MPPTGQRKQRSNGAKQSRQYASAVDGHTRSVSTLKKRRRDLRRLLEHSGKLPADVRVGYERELATCDADIEAASDHANRSRMIKRYHMVRFFERRKAERYLKKARQRLLDCEDPAQVNDLKQYVHLCDVDLNYTLYYPLDEAYSSLYKKDAKDEAASPPEVNRSSPMWTVVETAMAQNHLQALREGRLTKSRNEESSKPAAQPAPTFVASTLRSAEENESKARMQRNKAPSSKPKPLETRKVHPHEPVGDDDDDDQTGTGFFE